MTARGCTEKQERASPSDAEGGARIFAEEKREMGHLLCFYLLELGMAAAWCRWVICREVDLPALLRTARTVWSGERPGAGGAAAGPPPLDRGGGDRALPPGLAQDRPAPAPASAIPHPGWGAGPSAGLENVSGGGRPAGDGLLCAGGAGRRLLQGGDPEDRRGAKLDAGGAGGPAFPTWVSERAHAAGGVGPEKERAPCLAPAGCGGRFWNHLGAEPQSAAAGPVGEAAALFCWPCCGCSQNSPGGRKRGGAQQQSRA